MTREEAARILDAVIPPPEHHTVDLDHLRIAQAWACIKETLKAEPVKHGRWKEHHEPFSWMGYTTWTCSECDYEVGYEKDIKNRTDFCPNCGAQMIDEGKNDRT